MGKKQPVIYLDHNATTPCASEVLEAMLPWFSECWGNASSRNHPLGWQAEEAVNLGREQLAALLQVESRELVFTSGATEAINFALKGVFDQYYRKGNHYITVGTEHSAVIDTFRFLEKKGAEVTWLKVDEAGLINPSELEESIKENTVLVCVMWANNETGVIQPIQEIGRICAERGVLFMSDATQAAGKIKVRPREAGVHLLACSAHKMYGPKGVGALYISRRTPRVKLTPLLHGGGQENGLRSGTLNVPGIVGFGKAAEVAATLMASETVRLKRMRDSFEERLLSSLPEVYRNGSSEHRLPHVSNLSFRFVDAEDLIQTINRAIAASTGSACSSASMDPSPVLLAMGLSEDRARSAIRFSLGRGNTEPELQQAAEAILQGVQTRRAKSPVWELFVNEQS